MAAARILPRLAEAILLLGPVSVASLGLCGSRAGWDDDGQACVLAGGTQGSADVVESKQDGVEPTQDAASLLQLSKSEGSQPVEDSGEALLGWHFFHRRRREPTAPPTPAPAPQLHPPDMSDLHCRPTRQRGFRRVATGPQRRTRREIHLWTDEQFEKFSQALNALYQRPGDDTSLYPTTYASIVAAHPFCHETGPRVGPAFLPWHRHLLHDLETALQNVSGDCELTLPYWNSNEEAGDPWSSIVFDSKRYGMRPERGSLSIPGASQCVGYEEERAANPRLDAYVGGYCIKDGIAANWTLSDDATCSITRQVDPGNTCRGGSLPTDPNHCLRCVRRLPTSNTLENYPTVVERLEAEQTYEPMSDFIEFVPHVAPHTQIFGGTMTAVRISPADPVFFLHHAYVDKLFAWWQEYQLVRNGVDTSTCPSCSRYTLPFYNEPLEEWLGTFDPDANCVMYPKSNPRVCLTYQEHTADDRLSTLEAAAGPVAKTKGDEADDTSCAEVMEMIDRGQCPPGVLHSAIPRTCADASAEDMQKSCAAWIKSIPDYVTTKAAKDKQLARCIATVEAEAKLAAEAPHAAPANEAERKLCFKCSADLAKQCRVEALPMGGATGW